MTVHSQIIFTLIFFHLIFITTIKSENNACEVKGQIEINKFSIENDFDTALYTGHIFQDEIQLYANISALDYHKSFDLQPGLTLSKKFPRDMNYNLSFYIKQSNCEVISIQTRFQSNTKQEITPPIIQDIIQDNSNIIIRWFRSSNDQVNRNDMFYTLCYYRYDNITTNISYLPINCHNIHGYRSNTTLSKSLFKSNSLYMVYISISNRLNFSQSSRFSDEKTILINQKLSNVVRETGTESYPDIYPTTQRKSFSNTQYTFPYDQKYISTTRVYLRSRRGQSTLLQTVSICLIIVCIFIILIIIVIYKQRRNHPVSSGLTDSFNSQPYSHSNKTSSVQTELDIRFNKRAIFVEDFQMNKTLIKSQRLKNEFQDLQSMNAYETVCTNNSGTSFQTVSRQFNSAWDVGHALHVPGEIPEERYLVYQNNNTHKYTIDQSMNNIWRIVWEEGVHFMLTLAPSIKSANKQTDWLSDVNDTVIIEWETISMEKSDKKSKKHYRLSLTLSSVTDHRDNLVYTYQCKGHCSLITLSGDLSRDTSQERLVTELRFPHWPATESATPARVRDFSSLLTTVNVLNCCEGPIFVRTDLDRATPCGIFVVCHRLLRQLIKSGVINNFSSSHHRINVFETCLNSRIGSQLPVNNWKEYKFIYKVIVDILESSNQEI